MYGVHEIFHDCSSIHDVALCETLNVTRALLGVSSTAVGVSPAVYRGIRFLDPVNFLGPLVVGTIWYCVVPVLNLVW